MLKTLTKKYAYILLAVVLGIFTASRFVLADDLTIDNPLGDLKFTDIINKLIDFLLEVALVICPLMIVIGAFFFITAAGDPTKANKGRQVMIYAIIGLVIILISKGLVNLVKSAVGVTP